MGTSPIDCRNPEPEVTVALQGTIETFALPDVLRLLSSTKKTGCLRLDGSRGTGSLWFVDGAVVAGEASSAPLAGDSGEVLFELLRFESGDFVFDADITTDDAGAPAEVEPLLGAAEKMLEEWKEIAAVVPSLDHWVALAPELATDEVTISADRWRTLAKVGGGTPVGVLGEQLELGELPVSRAVKELVELGLVVIDEPRAGFTAPAPSSARGETIAFEPEPEPDFLASGAEEETDEEGELETFDPGALVIEDTAIAEAAAAPAASTETAETAEAEEPNAVDAAEIARQLANLSPKAAKAVAAAAKATTPEEREAALAEVDDEEDPINRELLIKFLGSVNS